MISIIYNYKHLWNKVNLAIKKLHIKVIRTKHRHGRGSMELKKQLKGWLGGIAFVIVVALGIIFQKQMFGTPTQKEILKKTKSQIINHIKAQLLADQNNMLNEAKKRGNLSKASERASKELKKLNNIKIVSIECRSFDSINRRKRKNMLRFFGTQKYLIRAGYTLGDSESVRYITLELKTPSYGNWQTSMTARIF